MTVYSFAHFAVDFFCAFLMFRFIAGTPGAYPCVFLYNFCAFALQMPLGIIADRVNKNYLFAVWGCLLVGLAYLLTSVPVLAVLVIGVGNALFHIGGGIDVLNISEKRLSALGLFVSPGAFGVYLGTLLSQGSIMPGLFIPLVLPAVAVMILLVYRAQRKTYPRNAPLSLEGVGSGGALVAVACFFLVVCLRSYVGLSLDFPWKGIGIGGIALICAVVFGKTIGGFAADRFGVTRTACISLGVAAFLFLFPTIPLAGVAAVLLFNMTMPLTLWGLAKIMPGAKGFAFGLLTFGLFLGFVPVYLGVEGQMNAPWLFTLLGAVSLALLWLGLRRVKQ